MPWRQGPPPPLTSLTPLSLSGFPRGMGAPVPIGQPWSAGCAWRASTDSVPQGTGRLSRHRLPARMSRLPPGLLGESQTQGLAILRMPQNPPLGPAGCHMPRRKQIFLKLVLLVPSPQTWRWPWFPCPGASSSHHHLSLPGRPLTSTPFSVKPLPRGSPAYIRLLLLGTSLRKGKTAGFCPSLGCSSCAFPSLVSLAGSSQAAGVGDLHYHFTDDRSEAERWQSHTTRR